MQKTEIFNPLGNDDVVRVIGGNSTNIFNLSDTKYSWTKTFYREMNANFWLPEKVSMSGDVLQYNNLSNEEKKTYKSILSFLTFLDSIQTNNIPNLIEFITAPEIKALLTQQQYQEVIHSQSYSYIIDSVIPVEERKSVYELWRDNNLLLDRNKLIASFYQDFINNKTKKNFYRSVIANFILESIFFYNGFTFFYSLALEGKMLSTANQIRYISTDEQLHIDLFANLINQLKAENKDFISEEEILVMFKEAIEQELIWNNHIFQNSNYITEQTTKDYVYFLANSSLKKINIKNIPEEYQNASNPYKNMLKLSGANQNGNKGNFFESTVTNYSQSNVLENWNF